MPQGRPLADHRTDDHRRHERGLQLERDRKPAPNHRRQRAPADQRREPEHAAARPQGVALGEQGIVDCDARKHQQKERPSPVSPRGVQQVREGEGHEHGTDHRQRLDDEHRRQPGVEQRPEGQHVEIGRLVVAERVRERLDRAEMDDVREPWLEEDRHVRRPLGEADHALEQRQRREREHLGPRPLMLRAATWPP